MTLRDPLTAALAMLVMVTVATVSAIATVATASSAMAQQRPAGPEPTVQARVDEEQIGEADSVTLTIEVRGSVPGRVEEPDLSGLADFSIAAGPSVSTSTSMVWQGGQATSTSSRQFTYVLLPRRRGTLTIPSVSVRLGSKVRQTDPITVEVVEGRVRKQTPSIPRGGAPGIPGARRRAEEPSGEVVVESHVDKTEAYIGEQILLTYKVYTQVELVELPSPQELPSYTGFWVEELPNDPRASIHRVSRGGEDFVELTLMKKALFPTSSGSLTIEESVFGLPVRASSRDPFDSIFFTPTRMVYRKTTPLTIRVKPLPEHGRPASFTGAVGKYTVSADADRAETRVSEALGLKIQVKGVGNIRVVGEPVLPPLPDYKRYEPQVDEKKDLSKDKIQGTKTWDYVLTALAAGPQDIPPIPFSYFDPSTSQYVEVATTAIPVQVMRSEGGAAMAGAGGAARREVVAFGKDVRYIKPVASLGASGAAFHRSATFAALLGAPLLLNAGLLLLVRRRDRMAADAGMVRGRRAPAFARRRLKRARALMDATRSREFHQEVERAVTGYVADKLDRPPAGLTHDAIEELLERRGISAAVRADLRASLEACDFARFAPAAPGLKEMQRSLEAAERVITRLEAELARHAGVAS